jgi:nucleotide-binding universal stress UspA family protein
MQTILVPLDGSPQAEQILPYVRQLAPVLQANVLLLQVVAAPEYEHIYTATLANRSVPGGDNLPDWLPNQPQRWLRDRQQIERYLDTQAALLRASGITVNCGVEAGPPVATIIAVAESNQASLIALASHGYSGLRRWAIGSVAEQIIQATCLPVLLVRISPESPSAPAGLRRILVPLDGSVFARYALDHAIAVAQGAQAELIVLQTLAPSLEDYIGGVPALLDRRSILREHVRRAYAARYGEQRATQATITSAIGLGAVADAIIEEAHHRHVGLIVLAMPEHSALRSKSSGRVADQVFHNSHIPLLLVHSPIPHD